MFKFITSLLIIFSISSAEESLVQMAALTNPGLAPQKIEDEIPDTLSISFVQRQKWIMELTHSIEIVPECSGPGEIFRLVESPRLTQENPFTYEFIVEELPEGFDPEGRNCIKQSSNIVHADIYASVAGIDLRSPIIDNAFGSAKRSSQRVSNSREMKIEGTHALNWIPPHFVRDDGTVSQFSAACNAAGIESRDFTEYPNECVSSVKVISKGPYTAKIQVYDNFGNFVHRSVQSFGACGELKNKSRDTKQGHVSWLVWNMMDSNQNPVGNGVYIWKVQFLSNSSAPKSYVYKQGIARTEADNAQCDIASR